MRFFPRPRTTTPQLDLLRTDAGETPDEDCRMTEAHTRPNEPLDAAMQDAVPASRPLSVPLSSLYEDPANPRTEFPEADLEELTQDIRQHGVLQPIVVHPADATGRFQIHFGAKRYRASARAGLVQVPVVVRDAVADAYAQVAENQRRHGLSPLDLARFIRSRVHLGESNAAIARRLGMDLTAVAHHLALLDLPAPLDAALKSGRCAAPRTLYELSKVHAQRPDAVEDLLKGEQAITREAVAALRPPARRKKVGAKRPTARPKVSRPEPSTDQLATRAERLCTQLAASCLQLRRAGFDHVPADRLAALRVRLGSLSVLLDP